MQPNITVIHMRSVNTYKNLGYKVIDITRRSPYGNPFVMTEEAQRDSVCEQYISYFNGRKDLQDKLYSEVKLHPKVALACWCKPKRCHGDSLKTWLETRFTNA